MTTKTRKAGASTPANLKNSLPTDRSMPDSGKAGQPLPRLSELLDPQDFKDELYYVLSDLAEDAEQIANADGRREFVEESHKLAEDSDVGDLAFLVRAWRHARANHGDELALPGRVLASILFSFGIDDLGTGRREETRRILALRNARERLTKAGVPFVDDEAAGVQ